uniref:P60 n=1 Tax=croton golden spot associated virus C TaxID=3072822 RepID=A0AA50E767_9CLOS|nr:p60 [croton golden spot associated virus C]
MVSIKSSDPLRTCFQLLFKQSDVSKQIDALHRYMMKNYRVENSISYKSISHNKSITYDSQFELLADEIHFVIENDKSIVKLIFIYFNKVEPDLLKKLAYQPGSLFISEDWKSYLNIWTPYLDKSMNDFLNDNKSLGCIYTEDDIIAAYPNQNRSRLVTLYKICNSQGRLIPIDEFLKGEMKGFNIPTADDITAVGEGISNNPLFKECVQVFKEYVRLVNSKIGQAKINVNKKFLDVYFDSMSSNPHINAVRDNPLVLAKFIREFDQLTMNSRGFADNMNAIKHLDKDFQRFIQAVFNVNNKLDEDSLFVKMPKTSVIEVLGQPISLSNYIRSSDLPVPVSNSVSLPESIDELVSEAFLLFFNKYKINDKQLILDALLFIFGKLTTNKAFWQENNTVEVTIDSKQIKFLSSDLNKFVKLFVKKFDPEFHSNNLIRQWANLRGDRALKIFKLTGFKPGLFSTIPGIVPWMRFDFFKLLTLQGLSPDEETSYHTLRLMTEYKSNRTTKDEHNFTTWISRN